MKQGKRPTRKQMDEIKQNGLNPENWFVERTTTEAMVLKHRFSDKTTRTIKRAV
ncbi:DUF6906 family protein [Paenibacillus agilis]|uniref:DUF6906 family protein n=1 Tax=Paenibacillus agilis TaxID=3020863 RepID=UPI00164A023B|nr:hypothetical protein [Paenibacillus agilis]